MFWTTLPEIVTKEKHLPRPGNDLAFRMNFKQHARIL